MMTSNFDIEYLLQNNDSFLGCFHKNHLPPFPLHFPSSLIIWTNNHWIGLLLLNKKQCFYFDSLGMKIRDKEIICYLKSTYRKIVYNSLKIQHNKNLHTQFS